jgi:hypothetical protein
VKPRTFLLIALLTGYTLNATDARERRVVPDPARHVYAANEILCCACSCGMPMSKCDMGICMTDHNTATDYSRNFYNYSCMVKCLKPRPMTAVEREYVKDMAPLADFDQIEIYPTGPQGNTIGLTFVFDPHKLFVYDHAPMATIGHELVHSYKYSHCLQDFNENDNERAEKLLTRQNHRGMMVLVEQLKKEGDKCQIKTP